MNSLLSRRTADTKRRPPHLLQLAINSRPARIALCDKSNPPQTELPRSRPNRRIETTKATATHEKKTSSIALRHLSNKVRQARMSPWSFDPAPTPSETQTHYSQRGTTKDVSQTHTQRSCQRLIWWIGLTRTHTDTHHGQDCSIAQDRSIGRGVDSRGR